MWQFDFSDEAEDTTYGVTFSHKHASKDLGLDWTEVYWGIIKDLEVKKIRIVAHWDTIEEIDDAYNFADFEWMLDLAEKNDVEVIIALGRKTPRWPECHDPDWIEDLSSVDQDNKLLEMIEEFVVHFRDYSAITTWQIENEALLGFFGECPEPNPERLQREVELVRSLDDRPILVTDSGELSDWSKVAKYGDMFGTTMYRIVWNDIFGVWRYPLPPIYYNLKKHHLEDKLDIQKVIVVELQAEPWSTGQPIDTLMVDRQLELFSLDDFYDNITHARKSGFDEVYLWGVEWWYWLRDRQDNSLFWDEAKKIWQ